MNKSPINIIQEYDVWITPAGALIRRDQVNNQANGNRKARVREVPILREYEWSEMTRPAISREEAIAKGFGAVTSGYTEGQKEMLGRTVDDMRGCKFALVKSGGSIEIWRHKAELLTDS